jgi:hypothetical protein
MNQGLISSEEFKKRLAQLCLTSKTVELPRRQRDRHILLKSVSLYFEPGRSYTESEINRVIEKWLTEVGQSLELDHVTLRRTLVDEGYLTRSATGGSYQIEHSSDVQVHFAADVDSSDPRLIVLEAVEEISKRRERHKESQ